MSAFECPPRLVVTMTDVGECVWWGRPPVELVNPRTFEPPPGIRPEEWSAVRRGLYRFIMDGHSGAAVEAGWSERELFNVPRV
jgi:hypothetical protein